MTTEEMSRDTKYMISVMQAYEDGKEIECRDRCGDTWHTTQNPLWNWFNFEHRVKPEPKYVPYDSVTEIDKDKWVKSKLTSRLYRIIVLDPQSNLVRLDLGLRSLEELFQDFTYEDGTPCGKKVSENDI